MSRGWIIAGAINGALAVGLGAYGAHNIDPSAADLHGLWAKATRYHMWHALALFGVAWVSTQTAPQSWAKRLANISGALISLGLILFCGGLYLLALSQRTTPAIMIPFGGTSFILAWLALAGAALGSHPKSGADQ